MSVAFGVLFALSIVGQAICGYALSDPQEHARGGILAYLGGADFLKAVFSNWQAALLQLLALIVFAVFLRQRGASHSRKPEEEERLQHRRRRLHWFGRPPSWAYGNSLSLAFAGLFVVSFAVFFFADLALAGRAQVRLGRPPPGALEYLRSAGFWFDVLQTWQAEFFAMGLFLVLSIFLRQEGSPESKPVGASDEQTGGTNE